MLQTNMIPVGFHHQNPVIFMTQPSGNHRGHDMLFQTFCCEIMSKSMKSKFLDSQMIASRLKSFLRIIVAKDGALILLDPQQKSLQLWKQIYATCESALLSNVK